MEHVPFWYFLHIQLHHDPYNMGANQSTHLKCIAGARVHSPIEISLYPVRFEIITRVRSNIKTEAFSLHLVWIESCRS